MRYFLEPLLKDLESVMVLISGPRQCGKTTFSKWLLDHRFKGTYLNWDQLKDRKRIVKQDWNERSELIVLDEIHKKKAWKSFLKGIFDTKPHSMRLLVTGSARLEMFQKTGESMFGRYRSWRLHPFCLAEDPLYLSAHDRFQRMLMRGGFPFPYLAENEDDAQRWRNQRWNLLFREDLRDLESIKDIQSFELLAELLKNYAASMISFSNLAEDVEVAPKTVKSWINILERLYLVFLLTPYSRSIKRSLSKTSKLYFTDPGDLLDQSEGNRIENLVSINLLKRLNYIEDRYGDQVALHYLRDKEGREVDFVITFKRSPIALIEVKKSFQSVDTSLIYFKNRLKPEAAIQLHTESQRPPVQQNGVLIISAQDFFSSPIESRKFWVR